MSVKRWSAGGVERSSPAAVVSSLTSMCSLASLAEEFCQEGTHATAHRSVGSRGLLFNGVGGEAVRKKPEDGGFARVEAVVVAVLQIHEHDVVVKLLVQHLRGVDSIPIPFHPKNPQNFSRGRSGSKLDTPCWVCQIAAAFHRLQHARRGGPGATSCGESGIRDDDRR